MGSLSLFGSIQILNHYHLAKSAFPGETYCILSSPSDLTTGDKILVQSSSFGNQSVLENEVFVVTHVSSDSKNVSFNDTFKFYHFGQPKNLFPRVS
jgi:hypothetical protein